MLIMLSSSWLCLFFVLSPNYINLVILLWLVQLQSSLRNLLLLTCLQECGPCFVCLLIWDYNKIKHLDFLLALRFALLAGIKKMSLEHIPAWDMTFPNWWITKVLFLCKLPFKCLWCLIWRRNKSSHVRTQDWNVYCLEMPWFGGFSAFWNKSIC